MRIEIRCAKEVRVPFLDHKLLEYCLNLPNELVINKSIGKVILREYVKNKFKNKFSYEIKKHSNPAD